MWSGYSFLMIGLLVPVAAAPFGRLFDACLWGLIRSVTWASSVQFGHLDVAGPPTWWMVGYYLGVAMLLLGGHSTLRRKIAIRGLLAWATIGLGAGLVPHASNGMSCRFLAVGHGLSVLVELPDGKTLLYDAGSMGDPRRAARIVSQELRRRGRRQIDVVIISHADADHCNGLPELLSEVTVGSVLIGPGFLNDRQPLPKDIVEQCAQQHVPVGLLSAGHRVLLNSEVTIRVLHPAEDFYSNKDNPLSLVTAVEYGGRRILLTGDLEGDGLTALLRQPALPCDVFLAPHHGSRAANPPQLARWSTPQWVIVSTQEADSEERVAASFSEETRVLATARHGAIEFHIDPHGELSATTFRGGRLSQPVSYAK
jgi:competence protein ComEC